MIFPLLKLMDNIIPVCYVLSHVQLFATPWTLACQAPLSLGFPRQESWSGLPFPSPGNLPNPGIEPVSPALAGRFFTTALLGKSWKIQFVWQFSESADLGMFSQEWNRYRQPWFFYASGEECYIIRTGYIICGAQRKMKMWGHLLKN